MRAWSGIGGVVKYSSSWPGMHYSQEMRLWDFKDCTFL